MFKGLKSLLTGLVAGTALGILFSPDKGKKIRKDIKSEIDKGGLGLNTIKDTISKMGQDIGEVGKDIYEDISETEGYQEAEKEVKKHVKKASAKAKKKVTKAKKQVKKAIKKNIPAKTRKKAKSVLDKVKSQIIDGMED